MEITSIESIRVGDLGGLEERWGDTYNLATDRPSRNMKHSCIEPMGNSVAVCQ